VAELSDRPFPPGSYPVIVVGSGPGGLQVSYCLGRVGVDHAVLSADEAPGGMFRRWPFFQRLLSWTKPFAPVPRTDPAYERYDWNSLLAEEPENKALMPPLMDGSSYFPSRPEMQRGLELFAERTGITVRYGCRWTATRRESGSAGDEFVLETSDGEYRAPIVVFAIGLAEPFVPSMPGADLVSHYAHTRPADTYADRRVFIIGKQVSAFELASGLLQWSRQIILASPSPTKLSVNTRSLVGVRARYVQPYEDFVLGGGVTILDASILAVEGTGDGAFVVRTKGLADDTDLAFDVDDVISATGFVCPIGDLTELGVATFGQGRVPAQTPYWESASVPGVYFAGTITQGAAGLKKHGLPANSGAVHGARYNARALARHIARARVGAAASTERPPIKPADLVEMLVAQLSSAPELWHQRAYLARVVSLDASAGPRDEGIVPLSAFVDGVGDDGSGDALAVTLESDGSGAIYPVVYARRNGRLEEHPIEADLLLRYDTQAVRDRLATIVSAAGWAARRAPRRVSLQELTGP
jgi:thioredoxin reductase